MEDRDVEPGEALGKFEVTKVRLGKGGYDADGVYWGVGTPLYRARAFVDYTGLEGRGGWVEWFFRAPDRTAAKRGVLAKYPRARFYR